MVEQLLAQARDEGGMVAFGLALEPFVSMVIGFLSSSGADTSGAQQAFADFSSLLQQAKKSLDSVMSLLSAIDPTDPAGAYQTLGQARSALTSAQADVQKAHSDLVTIHDDVVKMLGLPA